MLIFEIIRNEQVTEKDIEEALLLDYSSYDEYYHLETSRCFGFVRKNNYVYSMIKADGHVIAYINISPINDEAYERLRGGESDNFLCYDYLVPMEDNAVLNIYISSIVVSKKYRGQGLAKILINDAKEKYLKLLEERNITAKRVLGDAVSNGGEQILTDLHLDFLRETSRKSKVFEKTFDNKNEYEIFLKSLGEKYGKKI